jgi:hypothetical protein
MRWVCNGYRGSIRGGLNCCCFKRNARGSLLSMSLSGWLALTKACRQPGCIKLESSLISSARRQGLNVSSHSYTMKLVTPYSILLILFAACTQSPQKLASKDTLITPKSIDTTEEFEPDLKQIRQQFIDSYNMPLVIDTFFKVGNRKFNILFNHYCTQDNALVIPAKYNFDTNKDFKTHNFMSMLILMADNDTIFKKQIEKSLFNKILNPEERSYGTLLYPNLNLENDSITIRYSISIPVTDIGVPAEIKFDTSGQYRISQ